VARSRLILLDGDRVALIERHRDGRRYYVFPGGGIEAGETAEQAAIREAWEELGVVVAIRRLVARVSPAAPRAASETDGADLPIFVFLADITSGTFGSGRGEEMTRPRPERGSYAPLWLPSAELLARAVYPRSVARLVAAATTEGWPSRVVDLVEEA
jgi:8-oxo-dGTP diphosphatase